MYVGSGEITTFAVGLPLFGLLLLVTGIFVHRKIQRMAAREAAAVRTRVELFDQLYTRTPTPLLSITKDGVIEHVTDAWLECMDYNRDEVIGRRFVNFFAAPSDRDFSRVGWPMLLEFGDLRETEYRGLTKTGEILSLLVSARVEPSINRILVAVQDITEKKQIENELRQSQKMESIGQLTGGIAHDFNNILQVILGNIELIGNRVKDDAVLTKLADTATTAGRRAVTVTSRMLAFARRQDLNPTSVDIPDLVRNMTELLRSSVGPMIVINTQFPLGLPPALVDMHQLEAALVALIVNSRDAMPSGGDILIKASIEAIGTRTKDLAAGRYIRLSVIDNGGGMDEVTLQKAIEPYFTTKDIGRGSGLGLSGVQGLAMQSGGQLVLQSLLGRGTTVELWLPVNETAAIVSPPVVLTEHVDIGPKRFLIVDDDDLVLASTSAMIEEMGHAVVGVTSGADALQILEHQSYDFVVTDQGMAHMSGIQLATKISKRFPSMPILIVTGYSELPEGNLWPKLSKPFTQDGLVHAIADVIRQKNESDLGNNVIRLGR